MDPLLLTATVVGSLAAAATAIANWRLGKQSAREVQALNDEGEQRAAAAAGFRYDDGRWIGQRAGREVSVEFTVSSMPDTHGRGLSAIAHIPCAANARATFQLDDADLLSDFGLDISVDDATIDPFVRIRGSDADDVRALCTAPVRELIRSQLTETVLNLLTVRANVGGNNRPVTLPRIRRLWLDDAGLHVEWHHDRIEAHTKASLATFSADYLAEFAFQLETAIAEPRATSKIDEAATGADGGSVAVPSF